ncbi:MAG: DUF5615 family PIN-like protein [Planctomycetota bacterium]
MIILLDESMEGGTAERLRQDGHDVLCVWEMEPGISDEIVLARANERGALLITADKGFGALIYRNRLVSTGVVLVRLGHLSEERTAEIVSAAIGEHGSRLLGTFTVLSPGIIRSRPLSWARSVPRASYR